MKYTISVNADEYMHGLFDTEKEAEAGLLKLVEKNDPEMIEGYKEHHPKDSFYKDKPLNMYLLDMLSEMSEYSIKEVHGL